MLKLLKVLANALVRMKGLAFQFTHQYTSHIPAGPIWALKCSVQRLCDCDWPPDVELWVQAGGWLNVLPSLNHLESKAVNCEVTVLRCNSLINFDHVWLILVINPFLHLGSCEGQSRQGDCWTQFAAKGIVKSWLETDWNAMRKRDSGAWSASSANWNEAELVLLW